MRYCLLLFIAHFIIYLISPKQEISELDELTDGLGGRLAREIDDRPNFKLGGGAIKRFHGDLHREDGHFHGFILNNAFVLLVYITNVKSSSILRQRFWILI